ncbi:hypothetical protein [Pseudomonas orientalis]|uniref:hypothetical protein n=1 Tax=Pseudomonas orientalis TaxID=76758 RepID=UPI001B804DEE|nr:hypothetical protein [Pseudomonas orientalis]
MTLRAKPVISGTHRLENSRFFTRENPVAQVATPHLLVDDRICRSTASSALPTLVKLRNGCAPRQAPDLPVVPSPGKVYIWWKLYVT